MGAGPSGMRISGATIVDGTSNEQVNGDYCRAQVDNLEERWLNDRPVYQKVNNSDVAMWYAYSKWRVGSAEHIGSAHCIASVNSKAWK